MELLSLHWDENCGENSRAEALSFQLIAKIQHTGFHTNEMVRTSAGGESDPRTKVLVVNISIRNNGVYPSLDLFLVYSMDADSSQIGRKGEPDDCQNSDEHQWQIGTHCRRTFGLDLMKFHIETYFNRKSLYYGNITVVVYKIFRLSILATCSLLSVAYRVQVLRAQSRISDCLERSSNHSSDPCTAR